MQIADLIEQASMRDYAAQYTDLKEIKGEWWGISPLNSKDTNPSFSVRDNMYYDFSAGCGGNILHFIQRHDKCDFKTAVKTLCAWLGVSETYEANPVLLISALKKFKPSAQRTKECRHEYLEDEIAEQYKCRDFHFWDDEGLTSDVVARYGVGYDRRGECITIPVRDNDGHLINILCRTTNEHAKELGIPKYIYRYKLGSLDFFWGWSENCRNIFQKKEVIVVEGAKSVMKLASFGYDNAVAILTSHMTDEQLKILIRSRCDIVIALDKDINPYNDENIKKLSRYCRVYIATDRRNILDEKDSPCDKGAEAWKQIYDERKLMRC
jgi:DNA primase